MKKEQIFRLLPISIIISILILSACKPAAPAARPEPPTALPTLPQPSATPQATATPVPQVINVCTAEDPGNLFPYGSNDTTSHTTVFNLLNDGRFDSTLSDGGSGLLTDHPEPGKMIGLVPTTIGAGSVIVDGLGNVTVLQKGKLVRPSQCAQVECLLEWDGVSELKMDQLVVKYSLNPSVKWSDGTPLTAADYLFSYELMRQAGQPIDQRHLEVTKSFTAKNDYTIEWKAIPGFGGVGLEEYLPLPMPAHQLADVEAESLESSPFYREGVLSWGPYQVSLWEQGKRITLEANPHYYRGAEGLPKVDKVNVRFVEDQNEALRLLQAGDCDLLDSSYNFLSLSRADWQPYLSEMDFHLAFTDQATEMVFGIRPASYDSNYQATIEQRPDWFGDARTREAISLALTQANANQAIYGLHLPETVKMPPSAIFGPDKKYEVLLDAVGWKLMDGKRISQGVVGVADGSAFKVNLLTSQSQADRELGDLIVQTLAKQGIEVSVQALPLSELYAPGPNGPLFGRNFDLALVSWQANPINRCALYTSGNVPTESSHWIGTNLAGLRDEQFDRACGLNLVSFEPVSTSNSGARCEGVCKLFLEQSPSVKILDRVNLWVTSKALQMESDWTLNQIERMTKSNSN